MSKYLFPLSLLSLLTACVTVENEKVDKLYMCVCEQNIILTDTSDFERKESYTFIVQSDSIPSCCPDKLATEYTGYYETWENAETHPKVWIRKTNQPMKVSAEQAMTNGCKLENRVILAYDLTKSNHTVKEYYPNFYK